MSQIIKTVRLAYQHGVPIAYGTDEGVFPHRENWRDFPLLVEAGVPPMYAIQTATINAARLIKRDAELGSVTAGKFADIVAVEGDPLQNMQRMKRVSCDEERPDLQAARRGDDRGHGTVATVAVSPLHG